VVDGVPKLVVISAAVGGDRLPCSVSYCILASGPEDWFLVSAENIRPTDGLHDWLVLFLTRARNSLDSKLCGVVMLMQFSKSLSLPVGIGASFPKVLISSVSWNVSSFSALLQGV
jgi:hypothetical protein